MRIKVSLITILDVSNFGTYLQALATALAFQKYGAYVEIVHYERPFKNTSVLRKSLLLRGLYYIYFWLRGYDGSLFSHRCRKFISKNAKISKTYFSIDELKKNPPKADVYVTGSDQVWNTKHNRGIEEAYYLSYVPIGKRKTAYAASIGQDYIPNKYRDKTQELLSQYDAISVREDNAVDLLKSIGIDSTQVLDPTLLLNRFQWLKFASKRIVSEDYLLVYSVEPEEFDKKVADVAKYIAGEKHLKIVSVNSLGDIKQIPECDIYFNIALPQQFLSLIAHASFVVVSSFHGTAFAINFNKDFITIAPSAYRSRIDSLLKLTGLQKRIISDISEFNDGILLQSINYDAINSIMEKERSTSENFIKHNILKL